VDEETDELASGDRNETTTTTTLKISTTIIYVDQKVLTKGVSMIARYERRVQATIQNISVWRPGSGGEDADFDRSAVRLEGSTCLGGLDPSAKTLDR